MALLKPETRITRILEEARLLTPLQVAGGERSALTLSNITQNLDEFVGSAPRHDDITCVVVRRN